MWELSVSLFLVIVLAGNEHAMSFTSEAVLTSQVSTNAEAEPPGVSEIRVVHHQDLNKRILIALVVSSTLLGGVLLSLSYFWICRHGKSRSHSGKSQKNIAETSNGVSPSPMVLKVDPTRRTSKKGPVAVFDYHVIEATTNSFCKSNILDWGGSGSRVVYKAHLDEKLQAAVKRIENETAKREFENDISWLSKLKHQNIVKLLGYCVHGQSRFLVYEMMENGTLETELHGPTLGSNLTWYLRLRIVVDIARALEFLHEHFSPPVVHRDLKSSTILLDSKYNAKLSDFGFAITSGMDNQNVRFSETSVNIAPEYQVDGKLSDKSDVYAFGVVLLELLTGRRPLEKTTGHKQSIVSWAMPQLTDRSRLPSIVDPVIRNTMALKHLYQVAAVAGLCVQTEPSYRPLITDVLHSLVPLVPVELGGSLKVTEKLLCGTQSFQQC